MAGLAQCRRRPDRHRRGLWVGGSSTHSGARRGKRRLRRRANGGARVGKGTTPRVEAGERAPTRWRMRAAGRAWYLSGAPAGPASYVSDTQSESTQDLQAEAWHGRLRPLRLGRLLACPLHLDLSARRKPRLPRSLICPPSCISQITAVYTRQACALLLLPNALAQRQTAAACVHCQALTQTHHDSPRPHVHVQFIHILLCKHLNIHASSPATAIAHANPIFPTSRPRV